MLSVHEALDLLLSRATPVAGTDTVGTVAACGRVLAATQYAAFDLPPADNAAMDGYAVRSAGCRLGAALPVSQRITAGARPEPLAPGSAARIFTGAAIPPGADAVVMQEHCRPGPDGAVTLLHLPAPGEHLRRAGEDVRAGIDHQEGRSYPLPQDLSHNS